MPPPPPNMMRLALISLIRLYQRTIPRLYPVPVCRFEPSCSHYMVEALQVHGLVRGLGLGTWRLVRCQPLCAGGHDPVPPPRAGGGGNRAPDGASKGPSWVSPHGREGEVRAG